MQEALLYQKLDDNQVKCLACHHYCLINPGKRGICQVRENQKGTLYSLNFGKTIAASLDPIEKKPLYNFLPGSMIYSFAAAGCNFHCPWCQNWQISQVNHSTRLIKGQAISPEEHLANARDNNCPSIAYTYSEPTVFLEYALATMIPAQKNGLKNIWVSNGYMSQETLDLIIPYLDAANIDFKGDDLVYNKYCGGSVQAIKKTLTRLYAAGVHLEITSLIIPGVNDNPEQLRMISQFIADQLGTDVPWHISRFFPNWKMADLPITPKETMFQAKKIGEDAGLTYVYLGNV